MKTIKIDINDSVYEHILFFLKSLPSNLVKIQEVNSKESKIDTKKKIEEIFSKNDIVAFKDIEDPVKWQRELRDEWE
jgi:hypothetical protein